MGAAHGSCKETKTSRCSGKRFLLEAYNTIKGPVEELGETIWITETFKSDIFVCVCVCMWRGVI